MKKYFNVFKMFFISAVLIFALGCTSSTGGGDDNNNAGSSPTSGGNTENTGGQGGSGTDTGTGGQGGTTVVKVSSITISGNGTIAKDGAITLTKSVMPATATNKAVTWASSNQAVATITQAGKVSALAVGNTTITATAQDGSGVVSNSFELSVIDPASVSGSITINRVGGSFESAFVEWAPASTCDAYNVYVKSTGDSAWTKLDSPLIRSYAATAGGTTVDHWRADAVGLSSGTYQFKVVGTVSDIETGTESVSGAATVEAYDRSGFAFTGATTPGAYKADGTLKDNAIVLYVHKGNVSTVSYEAVKGANSSKTATYTGLQDVLSEGSLKNLTVPLCVRIIGTITTVEFPSSMWGSSAEGLQVKTTSEKGVTLEGIGSDATIWGFGILSRNTKYVEYRNFGVMCFKDDGISLDTDNLYTWVHNIDFFYGSTGGDGDQAKGDGSLDVKGNSMYQTYSYNHFWDSGKSSLCGMKSETGPNYLTYHHNWFDHSDSRHPRVRTMSVHVYNNYYDGVSKYGVGGTTGADIFVEGNYFRNCKFPMMSSLQGNDVYAGTATYKPNEYNTFSGESGGSIKSYNNKIVDTKNVTSYWPYSGTGTNITKGAVGILPSGVNTTVHFDAYEVSSRGAQVPASVKSFDGADTYSNFDTTVNLGVQEADIDEPDTAKDKVVAYAGRLYGGDFAWTFTEEVDTSYALDSALKAAVVAYKSKMIAVQGSTSSSSGGDEGSSGTGDEGDTGSGDAGGVVSGTIITFTAANASSSSALTGNWNLKSGCSITYGGVTYNICAKMESATKMNLTLAENATVKIVTDTASKKIYINGTVYTTDTNGVLSQALEAGTHLITKGDTLNVACIIIE